MKKIILSFIAAFALCLNTHAQAGPTYAAQNLVTFTNKASEVTNLAANAYSTTIDCRKQASVALQWLAGSTSGATSDTNSIFLQYSVDGLSWSSGYDTTPGGPTGKRVTITLNGETPVCLVTNIPTFGAGYLRILSATNSAGTAITTNVIKYGIKISAP